MIRELLHLLPMLIGFGLPIAIILTLLYMWCERRMLTASPSQMKGPVTYSGWTPTNPEEAVTTRWARQPARGDETARIPRVGRRPSLPGVRPEFQA